MFAHHNIYKEARCTVAERAVWLHLGLVHGDRCVVEAWMAKDLNSKVLVVCLPPGIPRLLRVRAAVKRPIEFSIRDYCPGVGMAKKKAINAIMMERKKSATDLRWRLNISQGDFELWSKLDREARWTRERLQDLGPLLPFSS